MNHPNTVLPPRFTRIRWLVTNTTRCCFSVALPAWAHPGHSLTEASPAHLLTSVNHLVALFAAGLAFILMSQFIRERIPRRSLQFLGVATTACAVLLLTIRP